MFNENQLAILNQELDSNRIKTRSKGNINLSYLEGFDVIATANRIFGFGNWEYSITTLENVSQEVNQNQNHIICYKAVVQVKVYDENHTKYIIREDVGFGTGIAKTLADAHEGGAKESVTDGLKRTLKSWGNQWGLSLYDKSKNHQNTTQNQSYNQNSYQKQPQQNANQQNYQANQSQQQFQQPYQHQQDFSQLTNIGLTIMQQGDNLIVVGDGIFEKKDTIRQNGFRWDSTNKVWYMPLREAA
jgi:DNA repair and recombination protein RAD52